MRRRLELAIPQVVIGIILAFATYSRGLNPEAEHGWLGNVGLWLQPNALGTAFGAAVVLGLFQIGDKVFGGFLFRKRTIRACVDRLANQCAGRARLNRITVFKRVSGFSAFVRGLWALRWNVLRKRKRAKLRRLCRLKWGDSYLVVWLRSSDAKSQRSPVAFRVSDYRRDVEGVAGLVWIEDFVVLERLPNVTPEAAQRVESLESLSRRSKNDSIRVYVERANIVNVEMLHSIETFAKHFMGQTINRKGVGPWGILLLDSEEITSPFPVSEGEPPGGCLGLQFQATAENIGHMLG